MAIDRYKSVDELEDVQPMVEAMEEAYKDGAVTLSAGGCIRVERCLRDVGVYSGWELVRVTFSAIGGDETAWLEFEHEDGRVADGTWDCEMEEVVTANVYYESGVER